MKRQWADRLANDPACRIEMARACACVCTHTLAQQPPVYSSCLLPSLSSAARVTYLGEVSSSLSLA